MTTRSLTLGTVSFISLLSKMTDHKREKHKILELLRRPTVIDMTDDGCGCFFLVFKNGKPNHWVGDSGVEKDMEEMIEFITDELTGEFKFTQF